MSDDKLTEERFDYMLTETLRKHSEPVPPDFTERMVRQIRQAEEQRILARVVWQQRLALAACIVLGVGAIVGFLVFPSALAGVLQSAGTELSGQWSVLTDKIPQTRETLTTQWRLYVVIAAALAFMLYGLLDLLVGDRLRFV